MSDIQHHELKTSDLHVSSYAVLDSTAKSALEATLVDSDRGLQVLQIDTGILWKCTAAATLVDITNNLSGEGCSVDVDGTITMKLGDTTGAQSVSITDVNDNELFSVDSSGALNIVCHNDEVVCHNDEVVLL